MDTYEVKIGESLVIGGKNPICVQSMTSTSPEDLQKSISQISELASSGCELVRLATPSLNAARALGELKKTLISINCRVPLSADVHFLPEAAFEALDHVETVRINPGNFAERKDGEGFCKETLERFLGKAKKLKRPIRIGVNHGSLSYRMLQAYGNTPQGMVESALEYISSAEENNFFDLVVSLKSSNVRIMLQAYQTFIRKNLEYGRYRYPLHLGVTEAGFGEEARIKSAIGIGILLMQGIGDTLRISLTEPSTNEILAAKKLLQWTGTRNELCTTWPIIPLQVNQTHNPEAWIEIPDGFCENTYMQREVERSVASNASYLIEGLVFNIKTVKCFNFLKAYANKIGRPIAVDLEIKKLPKEIEGLPKDTLINFSVNEKNMDATLEGLNKLSNYRISLSPTSIETLQNLKPFFEDNPHIFCGLSFNEKTTCHDILQWAHVILDFRNPIWLRNAWNNPQDNEQYLMQLAMMNGFFLCYGRGQIVSIPWQPENWEPRLHTIYHIFQACRLRQVNAEFISCPSCGRTQFDISTVAKEVKNRLAHLKGLKIAVMGCMVNGPGEMADADFGYVGGGKGKVNLYVKQKCVRFGIEQANALDTLIDVIKENGSWQDPVTQPASSI